MSGKLYGKGKVFVIMAGVVGQVAESLRPGGFSPAAPAHAEVRRRLNAPRQGTN